MLPTDRFVAGLAAFLVAHVWYVAGLWTHGPGGVAFAVAAAVVVLLVAPVGRRILGALRERRDLVVPVGLYMVVISVMFATALATGHAWSRRPCTCWSSRRCWGCRCTGPCRRC